MWWQLISLQKKGKKKLEMMALSIIIRIGADLLTNTPLKEHVA
jgi:hypothetical protein